MRPILRIWAPLFDIRVKFFQTVELDLDLNLDLDLDLYRFSSHDKWNTDTESVLQSLEKTTNLIFMAKSSPSDWLFREAVLIGWLFKTWFQEKLGIKLLRA